MLKMIDVKQLVRRSHRATCGAFEREVNVPTSTKHIAIRRLKEKGFRVIGTSYNGGKTTKIWFISRGLAGL